MAGCPSWGISSRVLCSNQGHCCCQGCADCSTVPANATTSAALPSLKSFGHNVALELCTAVDDEFRLSQHEKSANCASSVSLATLWEQLTRACDDPAFLSVASGVRSEFSGVSSLSFSAELLRTSGCQRFGFGCRDVPADDGDVLMVTGISRGGCVEAWNDECARQRTPWKRLLLCSVVLSVNGVAGECVRMRNELFASTHAVLIACNPPSVHEALLMLRAFHTAAPVSPCSAFWAADAARGTPQTDHVFV
mmetsp:Transcript_115700/g.367915  ORF Transcript_115700/g.367915 Transcript_115700/m.367915 type:complete len:251 (+) Transcript_115700:118-870(+)